MVSEGEPKMNVNALPATTSSRTPHHPTSTSASTSSLSLFNSLPSSPRRPYPALPSHTRYSTSSVGILTPSSSKASLSPAYSRYKDCCHQPPTTPTVSPDKPKRTPPNRRLFLPVRASLELYTHTARGSAVYMPERTSRPGSPVRRSRALSPKRTDATSRPPSRCVSMLRDTLRRADEQERSLARRPMSRSPERGARGRSRLRGNSIFEALRRDESVDSDCDFEENVFRVNGFEGGHHRSRTQAMPMPGRGTTSVSSADGVSLNYGSPSSPSPMPPSMMRTRTAPTVPRVKGRHRDEEQRAAQTLGPQLGRRSLPNTVLNSQAQASVTTSNETSPKQRLGTLSPHDAVLLARLDYVLQKAGSPPTEDAAFPPQVKGRDRRNHSRTFSYGVTSPKHRDRDSSNASSPQSLAASSLSNSATDLARAHSSHMHGHLRDSAHRSSSSSPPEPLTPPPTPPFNARIASEVCKRIDGYVSFASVEGLGEPPGLDIDSDEGEEGLKKWGRWFRSLPRPFMNGTHGPSAHEAQQLIVNRQRSGSQ